MGEEKTRKCLGCKKQLLDEKFPFCLRCRLAGRNTVANVGEAALLLGVVVAVGGKAIADNNNSKE